MPVVAAWNAVVALFGPVVISISIATLEDEFVSIRTGGDYTSVWFGLVVGAVVWVAGSVWSLRSKGTHRSWRMAAWVGAQLAVVLIAFAIAPHEPWS
jgi:hypothetical protein